MQNNQWKKLLSFDKFYLYYLVPVLFIIITFSWLFLQKNVFIASPQDIFQQTMPYEFRVEHPFALWNNAWLGGFPEYASPMSDTYYPFSFPFYFLTRNIYILNFVILAHLFIAYVAFHKFGSLVTENKEYLLFFSLVYMFSGAILSRLVHPFILFALAWVPFVLYYFLKLTLRAETNTRNILLFSIFMSILFLTGMIYQVIFCFFILLIFIFYYLVAKKLKIRQIVSVGVGIALFLLLVAIKLIPSIFVSGLIIRVDPINPMAGGGFLESILASFIFGTSISEVYSIWESLSLVGIVIIFLAIIGLLYAPRDLAIPGFFSILFAFLWADGGNTLFSFIHLLPVLDTLRCPGRILGAITPVILLFAIIGCTTLRDVIQRGERLVLNEEKKKMLLFGVILLVVLKITEIPYQNAPSYESIISVILVAIFILLLYFNKNSKKQIFAFFGTSIFIELLILTFNYNLITLEILIKILLMAIILIVFIAIVHKLPYFSVKENIVSVLLVISLFLAVMASFAFLAPGPSQLENSKSIDVINAIDAISPGAIQPWVLDTGWTYMHIDFTYWYLRSGLHPINAYYAYYLKDQPGYVYKLGNITYFTVDWIVDTKYLENGQQNMGQITLKVDNISIYRPENVLPNAFVIRGDRLITGNEVISSPDIVMLTGSYQEGDIAVLKSTYYPGWKVNGQNAESIGNMVGIRLTKDVSAIRFSFEPLDFYLGLILTIIGISVLILLIMFRKNIDANLKKM
jgi:hypothetical protein